MGDDYQVKLVKAMIEDAKFFMDLSWNLDPNMFTVADLRMFVSAIKDRYDKTAGVMTYKDLDFYLRSATKDVATLDRQLALVEEIKKPFNCDISFIKDRATAFFRQQKLVKGINEALPIIQAGDVQNYGRIEEIVREAIMAGDHANDGYGVFDGFDEALSDEYRRPVPTGADLLDNVLRGGLGKGELGIIIAPSGVGKTSATTGFAAYAATKAAPDNNGEGYKVLHIHFEDKEVDIKRKYYAYLTDIESYELSLCRDTVKRFFSEHMDLVEMIKRNVVCFRPMDGECGVSEIESLMMRLASYGFKPDMVIVDYFECLRLEPGASKNSDAYEREGLTMRRLETIARKYDVALWCPIQGTKGSIDQESVSMSQGGGSVKKVQIGHVVLSFARLKRDDDSLNISIHKFRAGRIVKSFLNNVKFNNGTCKFSGFVAQNI